jgi:CHAT domain-containing protein
MTVSRRWSLFLLSVIASVLWAAPPVHASSFAGADTEDPLAGVEDLILARRYAEAQVAASNAQRTFGQRGDRFHEALAVLVSAAAELSARDFTGAAADAKRSAAVLEEQGDRFSFWLALWHVGVLERAQGQPAEAVAQLRRALVVVREIEASSEPFSAEGLRYLGKYLEKYFQMPPDLLRALPTRPEAVKPVLLRFAEAMTRRGILDVLLDTGQLDAAEAKLTRLGELSQQLAGMFSEEAVLYRGTLRRLQWRLDEAREIFRRALEKPNLSPGREMEILASLIELEIAGGRLDEALALTDRALALARKSKDPSQESKLLMFRAEILRRSRNLATAKDALEQAVNRGGAFEQALAVQQRGHLALEEGRPEEAAKLFESAAQRFHDVNRPEHEAYARLQLSLIYTRLGSRASAAEALVKAREIAATSGSPQLRSMMEVVAAMARIEGGTGSRAELQASLLDLLGLPDAQETTPPEERRRLTELIADTFRVFAEPGTTTENATGQPGSDEDGVAGLPGLSPLIRGIALFHKGKLESARRLWLAALQEGPRPEVELSLLAFIGFSYGKEGKDDEAIRYLRRAAAAAEQGAEHVRLEELLAGYWGSEAQVVFSELIDALVRNGQIPEAFEVAERARARALLQALANPRLAVGQGADGELVREAGKARRRIFDLQRRLISATLDERTQRSAGLLRAQESYQALLVRLKVTERERIAPARVEPLQVSAIRQQLGRETSLVSYFVSSSLVHAWVLDREGLVHFTLPLGRRDLRRVVCWADQLGRGGRGTKRVDQGCGGESASAEDLYQKLIAPLRGHLHHRRLILVPHGELHYLPFAALHDPQSGHYLIEDFTLSYAPSASVIGPLRAKETPVDGTALVLGAPQELDTSLRRLPASKEEAELVGRLFGVRPLLGRDATESRLYQLAGKVDLLHIAAHGFFEPRNPLFSHIALAPDGNIDGRLEVHEILSDLDLSGVNLVVLSACETARGERSRGDEVLGLTRAILDAGSPGVISTLWNISDEAAAALMAKFYRHLLDGMPVAEALQQAQLALLHNPRFQDPGYWAAFSLAGDPQGRWGQSQKKGAR